MIWFYFSIQITLLNGVSSWMSNGEEISLQTMIPMQEISWFQQSFLLLRISNFSNCAKEDADDSNECGEIQREFLVLWKALGNFEPWSRLLCWLSAYYLTSQCHIPHPLSTSINPETSSAAKRLECRGEGSM